MGTDKYVIGVDGGSQSSKVVVYDAHGRVVSSGRVPLRPLSRPSQGVALHPDDDLWDSIAAAGREAMAGFRGDPADVVGVGLCTIRCCRATLRADGSLASPVMSWMDSRAYLPYEPDDPDARYLTTSSGYITHRLTGRFADTIANYIEGQWPVDADAWAWSADPAVRDRWRIPAEMLFELVAPGAILGRVTEEAAAATGFPAGIPVVATANDKAVEALGSGSLDPGTALVSLGTYIAAMVHGERNVGDAEHFWTNFASVPGRYLYESAGIRRGMWTVTWFLDLLGPETAAAAALQGMTPEQYMDREAMSVAAGSDGLMSVLDWLAPNDQPHRKGIMIGFDARHTRAHVYRSILEAIALTMKRNVDLMFAELDRDLERIVVSGGGSKSPLMMRIFADVFGVPAERSVVNGGASLGAAVCAAVAAGLHPDFETAAAAMTGARESLAPVPGHHEVYRRMNDEAVYPAVRAANDDILRRSHAIFG